MKIMNALLVTIAVAATVQTASANPVLAKSKNCVACHAASTKLVGPSFKDIATKYAKEEGAPEKLAQKIRKGSQGVWGPVPMPANPQVNEDDAVTLARWILAQG
jgi:cytochrome c